MTINILIHLVVFGVVAVWKRGYDKEVRRQLMALFMVVTVKIMDVSRSSRGVQTFGDPIFEATLVLDDSLI